MTGAAARAAGPVSHDTSGTLVGSNSILTGAASRTAAAAGHDVSGALSGGSSVLAGSASRFSYVISGVTRDATGAVLPGVVVKLFDTGTDTKVAEVVSGGAGAYQFTNPGSGPFYAVAHLPGSPDVAGCSINTLTPTAT